MVKILNHIGKVASYKLDQLAKMFISKGEIMDISLQGQEDRIDNMLVSLRDLKAARKNLEAMRKKNESNIATADSRIKSYLKQGKNDMVKLQIKFKLEQKKQNEALDKSVVSMKEREKVMAKSIDRLKDILEISRDKVEFYKSTHAAAKTSLEAIDFDTRKNLDLKSVLSEIEQEVVSMDNKIEAIGEMEKEGLLKQEEDLVADAEVEEEFERLKKGK